MSQPTISYGPLKGPDTAGQLILAGDPSGVGNRITYGAVLPSLAARAAGDLHYLTLDEGYDVYQVQGSSGTDFFEHFDRANSAVIGNGWTRLPSTASMHLVSAQLQLEQHGTALVRPFDNNDLDVACTFTGQVSPGIVLYSTATGGASAGYCAQIIYSATGTNVSLRKDNVVVATGHFGSMGVAIPSGTTLRMIVRTRDTDVSVLVEGVEVITWTDSARPSGIYTGVMNSGTGPDVDELYNDFHIVGLGSKAWVQVDAAVAPTPPETTVAPTSQVAPYHLRSDKSLYCPDDQVLLVSTDILVEGLITLDGMLVAL